LTKITSRDSVALGEDFMTILSGDYEPVKVQTLDVVGYLGKSKFVLLQAVERRQTKLPAGMPEADAFKGIPTCVRAKVENNQAINFSGVVATLHDVSGEWMVRIGGTLQPLQNHSFFEIGHCK
jgi:hypothetical protein